MKSAQYYLCFLVALLLLSGCSSSQTEKTQQQQNNPENPKTAGDIDTKLVGKWRSYSDLHSTRLLELRADGTWQFGTSSGKWSVAKIDSDDWGRWYLADSGLFTRKIILDGWNKGMADGPLQESGGNVDFIYILYNVTYEGVEKSVQLKYGRSNWD